MKRICLLKGTVFFLLLLCSYSADALCVNVSKANLRKGPGTGHEKTWEVFKYMPFRKIGSSGNWYKVQDVDGDVHWIYKNLTTDMFDCAVVKVETANVRQGPGTNHAKTYYSPVMKYASFKVLTRTGPWINVLDEYGEKGWIYRKLLWIY